MATKLSKIEGKVSYDAKYIFQLGPRPSLFSQLRAEFWGDEHLRNLEMARYLLAHGNHKELSEKVFQIECDYLAQLGKTCGGALIAEVV